MTDKQLEEYRQKIKDYTKKITETPEEATKFLQRVGIIDKNGKLTKYYR